jgi:hypothetical protein
MDLRQERFAALFKLIVFKVAVILWELGAKCPKAGVLT